MADRDGETYQRRHDLGPASVTLAKRLHDLIRCSGPIGLDRYMAACLSDPEFGYYTTRNPLGRGGDFVTAPEISQIFGEMVGLWTAAVWQQLEEPAAFRLIELGPGRGTLMADLLRALKALPACHDAARVDLVEISPILKDKQREILTHQHPTATVAWHERIDTVAADLPCIVIANEFFDALPIRQWVRRGETWCERQVANAAEGLVLIDGPPSDPPQAPEAAEEGDILEFGEAGRTLAAALATRLNDRPGACLVIDYGYAGMRCGDSLQAIRDHGYVSLLDSPGAADLTAHVDFSVLGDAFAAAGAVISGPVAQRLWLRDLGAGARAERLMRDKDAATVAAISQGLRRLLDPMAMGTLFKVMAAASNGLGPLPGFTA